MTDIPEQQPSPASRPDGKADLATASECAPREGERAEEPRVGVTECSGSRRNRRNFWLDITTALTFCTMVGSGVLLEFVLDHRGGGTWLGWTRHDWGEVHFWVGVALLTLVVVHLILHRDWIARCWRRFAGSLRSPVSWALMVVGLALMVAPLLIPAEAGGGGRRYQEGEAQAAPGTGADRHDGQGARGGRGHGRRAADRGAHRR
jgi:hypothetical protein